MATKTFRGKAQVAGFAGTIDVVVYPVQQSGKLTHKFEMEKIKDADGQFASARTQNEMVDFDLEMKLVGDTAAHAATGAAFLAPQASVTLSAFTVAQYNGVWIYAPDSSMSLKNDSAGDMSYRLEKYVDATQNTLMTTTPS